MWCTWLKILYHWRISENSTAGDPNSKLYAWDAGVKAVQAHLDRLGIAAKVYRGNDPFTYKVAYAVPESHPLVSIVIPTKDHPTVLDTCIKSIIERSTYDNYEIIIIENNSENPRNIRVLLRIGEKLSRYDSHRILGCGI